MSEENKQPKPRITSWIRIKFGEEILEEIRTGKRTIKLNGKQLNPIDKNFRDKRVTGTSKVEINPPVPDEKATPEKEELEESEELEKRYVKDFLTAEDIKTVESGKANVFVDGLAVKLDKEIFIDRDEEPVLDGKQVIIKVLPQFAPG